MNQFAFRYFCLLLAVGCVSIAVVYMALMANGDIDFPSWTVIFYVLFFWFFWVYAKTSKFSKSLFSSAGVVLPRALFFLCCLLVFIFYLFLKKGAANEGYASSAPLMAILAIQYVLVGLICIFGDRFLGVFRWLLKGMR